MKTRHSRYEERAEDFAYSLHYLGNPTVEMSVPKPPTADPPTIIEWQGETWMLPRASLAIKLVPAMASDGDVIGELQELGGWRVYPVDRGGKTVYVTVPE